MISIRHFSLWYIPQYQLEQLANSSFWPPIPESFQYQNSLPISYLVIYWLPWLWGSLVDIKDFFKAVPHLCLLPSHSSVLINQALLPWFFRYMSFQSVSPKVSVLCHQSWPFDRVFRWLACLKAHSRTGIVEKKCGSCRWEFCRRRISWFYDLGDFALLG